MPATAIFRAGLPAAALALGLGLASATPFGAAAEHDPMHGDGHHDMHHGGGHMEHGWHDDSPPEPPTAILQVSGSGAVAAVQHCGGEVHAGTSAGGVDAAALLLLGCTDPGDDTAVISRAASGALAAATGGLALTAPAAAAPSLFELATLNAAAGRADAQGGYGYGHKGGYGGVKEAGYEAAPAAETAPVSALPATGAGDAAGAAMALQAAIAAMAAAGSAGAGLALRLRSRRA